MRLEALAFGMVLLMTPVGASVSAVPPPAPVEPVPSARQLAWHELEYYGFVHFGVNTFTDREWGEGREDPTTFAPTALDCRQWTRVCRDAGMTGIIITAKHHDGFCLWPSAHTAHSVAASGWRDGDGDVLRELSDACRDFGLKFGVYLSPWDRHHPDYGDSPRYNAHFKRQLEEVLTSYGEVFEVWFDGACGEGPNGRRQVYDWPGFIDVVRRHQPNAVIFSDAGPDIRWVGNESGFAGKTNWSLLRRDEFEPGTPRYRELTEGHADGTHWLPAECDVSIRPGWFYHPAQDDMVKTLAQLEAIYYASVGRNGALLLNLPVDRRGLVHETDVERLMALRRRLDATFRDDVARDRPASASDVRGDDPAFAAARAVDGRDDTYWATDDGVTTATLEVDLEAPTVLNRIVLAEFIARGQRVESFGVDAYGLGGWRRIAEGTTIGHKRILRFPGVTATKMRLAIIGARASPAISRFALYAAPPEVTIDAAATAFTGRQEIRLSADLPGAAIHYTLDGSAPTTAAPRYDEPIVLARSATVRAIATLDGKTGVQPAERVFRHYRYEDLRDPTLFIRAPDPGLTYRYHEGAWQSLDDLRPWGGHGDGDGAVTEGHATGFDLDVRRRDEHFALLFRGFVEVPADGVYTFFVTSDDGSRLHLGDDMIVDNDGRHGPREVSGPAGLKAGHHPFTVSYFNATGGRQLAVEIAGPGLDRQTIPPSMLFVR